MTEEGSYVWEGWLAPNDDMRRRIERKAAKSPVGSEQRSLSRVARRLQRQEKALARLQQHRPALYRGDRGVVLSSDEVRGLVESICSGTAGYELRDAQRYIVKGLSRGVAELGWDLPVPTPIVVHSAEPSNVTPNSFEQLAQYDALDQVFWDNLGVHSVDAELHDIARDAGQLLFSMVFHSGVCSKHWLMKLPESIRDGAGVAESVVWLDLGTQTDLGNTDFVDRRRRQFMAPVTQLLLRRWYQRWGLEWPKEKDNYSPANTLLKQFALDLCEQANLAKQTANHCLSMSAANLATVIPNTLLYYAQSKNLGTPLPEHNWLRLLKDRKPIHAVKSRVQSDRIAQLTGVAQIRPVNRYSEQSALFRQLRECLKVETAKGAKERIQAFVLSENVSPILQLMANWAHHLLQRGGAIKGRLEKASVVRYLNWIRPLVSYADDLQDPLSLDEDSWQAIYDEIIANAQGAAADRAGRLVSFHQFLEEAYGIPPVDIAGASAERQVDARILTPREYQKARAVLQARAKTDEWALCQEMLLILGYRCGLRRGEAFSRRLGDFPGMDDSVVEEVELLVRPNKNANIKSEAGTRRLPLRRLLTDEEFSRLSEFYRQRRSLVTGNAEIKPLFADTVGGHWTAATAQLFDPLTRLLQKITGDGRFRFHHLRHSFVTLTFLRLMELRPGEHLLNRWYEDGDGTVLLPSMEQPLWQRARLTDTGQSLWLLSMWAGHASPSVTLECYSHLLDWLVRSYLRQRYNPMLSLRQQSFLLGKTPVALEKWRQRQRLRGGETPAIELADMTSTKWPAAGCRTLLNLSDYGDVPPDLPNASSGPGRQVGLMDPYHLELWSQMCLPGASDGESRGLDAVAAQLGISMSEASRWHRNAEALMAMRTNRQRTETMAGIVPLRAPNRSRLSGDNALVNRALNEKDINKGNPALWTFVAPPKTPAGREFAKKYFRALIDWHAEDPSFALDAMKTVLGGIQRSHTQIRLRGVNRQVAFYVLLCRIGLKSRTTIRVNVAQNMNKQEAKNHWAAAFDTETRQVQCIEVEPGHNMGVIGLTQVYVEPPNALNRHQNLFWDALRFALMSAYVVCADEPC